MHTYHSAKAKSLVQWKAEMMALLESGDQTLFPLMLTVLLIHACVGIKS